MSATASKPAPWLRWRDIGVTPASIGTVLLLSLCGQLGYFGFLLIVKALMDAMRAASNLDTYLAMAFIFVWVTVLSEIYLHQRATMLSAGAQRFGLRLQAEALQSSVRNAVRVDMQAGAATLQDIVTAQRFVAGPALTDALDLVGAVLAVIALFYVDEGFGWISVAGILSVFAIGWLRRAATARPSAAAEARLGEATGQLAGDFTHADTGRGLGQLVAGLFRWYRRYDRTLEASHLAHVRNHAIEEVEHLVTGAFVLGLMVHGIALVFAGTGTMGLVLCAFFGGYKAIAPFAGVVQYWASWNKGISALRRLQQVLRQDAPPPVHLADMAARPGLVVEQLGFWPEGRATPVLEGIDVHLPPGSVALVQGRNGAGKSTFLRLVLGLLRPTTGRVLLAGQNTHFCDREELGSQVGYLPQDIQLLDATVQDNIGRGPGRPLAEVVDAARHVGIHDMIGRLPQGYRTACGSLAAGQQRLIALARALLGGPCLLVLDEPEAGLDGAARHMLLAAVERVRLAGGVVLVVTHEPEAWAEAAHYVLRLAQDGGWSLDELRPPEPVAVPQRPVSPEAGPAAPGLSAVLEAAVPGPTVPQVMRAALVTLGLTLVPLIGWATMSRMEQAVLAPGQLVPEGRRKTVNLQEAGILQRLLVEEGSIVRAGEPLAQLDITQADAAAAQLRAAAWSGRVRLARFAAEQAEQRHLAFPAELEAERDPALVILLQAERALFAARWAAFDGQVEVQERAIGQLREQVAGVLAQREGAGRQVMAVHEQIAGYARLLAQGYASRFLVLNLQQQEAGLVAAIGLAQAQEAGLREGIAQAERQLEGLRLQRQADIAAGIQIAEAALAAARQQLRAAQDVLLRREVLAPEAGRVTSIQAFTPGASIQPGQAILDLVPVHDRLVAELHVQPTDIDQVAPGQRARIRLTALRQASPSPLRGRVLAISPDVRMGPDKLPYFLVRVELEPEAEGPGPQPSLAAGMPIEAFLLGEERTPLEYFWEPVKGSARRPLPPGHPEGG
jgi:HlyD family type I secretion membrane fusion protein